VPQALWSKTALPRSGDSVRGGPWDRRACLPAFQRKLAVGFLSSSTNPYRLLAVALLAGASERLLPSLIKRFDESGNQTSTKNGGPQRPQGPPPVPRPWVGSISPNSAVAGGGPVTLTVTGGNFTATSVVVFNGADMATTFVSDTQIRAVITRVAPAGNKIVYVKDGGETSNIVYFIVP